MNQHERNGMEDEEKHIAERLEAATSQLEKMLNAFDERAAADAVMCGEVGKISATVEQSRRELELMEKLASAEKELVALKASGALAIASPLRRTLPTATSEMLAKHGIGEGPVDVRALDAALSGLSLEQRIAVKTQLMRAGAIA
jgi:hypothetical protein